MAMGDGRDHAVDLVDELFRAACRLGRRGNRQKYRCQHGAAAHGGPHCRSDYNANCGLFQISNSAQTGTWSDGFSPSPRTWLSIWQALSRSAAWGDSMIWSMRMPALRRHEPA